MTEVLEDELLSLAKSTVQEALGLLSKYRRKDHVRHYYSSEIPKELKAEVDFALNDFITTSLLKAGIPILSEEDLTSQQDEQQSLRFVLDPLDGTVNYVRNIGESAVSIALFDGNKAIFGVVGIASTGEMIWGGKRIGSHCGTGSLSTSEILKKSESILCTGFPARFNFEEVNLLEQCKVMSLFGKVRMLGSASVSLVQVAKGSAECYFEKNIMIWDVAAGVALVEGAGGSVFMQKGDYDNSFNVVATNGALNLEGIELI